MSDNSRPFDSERVIDVICMGRVAVDFYAEQIHSPLEDAQSFRKYLGGCAGNTAVGASRLGLKSAMFSCVGADDMGIFLRKHLRKEGVDTTLLQTTPRHLTGLVLLGVSPPDRFPLIFYRENCADMQIMPEHSDPEMFRKAKALLITGTGLSTAPMREATLHAVNLAKKCGCAVIMDIDYRPVLWGLTDVGNGESRFVASAEVTRQLQPFLPMLDLIVGTEEEVMIAGGRQTLESSLEAIRELSSATVVIKRGADGCEVYRSSSPSPVSARPFKIEVLNVLGAGDAFMSGFLRGWLRQEPLETCALWGNANGALTVTRHGCSPSMASFEELQMLICRFDEEHEIFVDHRLRRLHQRTGLGTPRNGELLVLAFDHRLQFENSCREHNVELDRITVFKNRIYDGFLKVQENNRQGMPALLVDPDYGKNILQRSAYADFRVGAPIEQSGVFPIQWIAGGSLYQHLLKRPASWFVKVLWQFHPGLATEARFHQLEFLRNLEHTCHELERKLMVELIPPDGFPDDADSMASSIREVYENGVYPFWWKISVPDSAAGWNSVTRVMDEYDPEVGVILLGKNAPIEHFHDWFRIARATPHTCGFAIGRSIFWEPWEQFIRGELDQTGVSTLIASRYQEVIEIWRNS